MLTSLLQNIRQIVDKTILFNTVFVRYASKKSGTSSRNRAEHVKPKHRGFKRRDGQTIKVHEILFTQYGKLSFHPGLNVGIGHRKTLFALTTGKVRITCEEFDPDWNRPRVVDDYGRMKGMKIYKKYFNVIPEPMEKRFDFIDSV